MKKQNRAIAITIPNDFPQEPPHESFLFFFWFTEKKRTDGNKNEGSNLRRVGEASTITVNLSKATEDKY